MTRRLAALILLCTMNMIQTEVPHQINMAVVEVGGNFTFHCTVPEGRRSFNLYKQSLGYTVQRVFAVVRDRVALNEEFNNTRFTVTEENTKYFLTIGNISKEDEATYFCLRGTTYSVRFDNTTFLAVKDRNQRNCFYVKQSPDIESVQPGDSVTLQCSLHSKNKENTDQCPGEHSVYWFRSGSAESHPGIIYTHSDEEEGRRCVYSLSKTIQNSDTGTYYCAVVTCGEILFGEGTKVETRSRDQSGAVTDGIREWDPVNIILGILLGVCVIVIAILIFSRN